MTRRRKKPDIPQPGQYCLIGRAGISMPTDWILCRVVFADAKGVLVNQWSGGDEWRSWFTIDEVRATGDLNAVRSFQDLCRGEVEGLQEAVKSAEAAADAARKAVWAKLDEIGAV